MSKNNRQRYCSFHATGQNYLLKIGPLSAHLLFPLFASFKDGATLHLAAERGDFDALELLISQGADTDAVNQVRFAKKNRLFQQRLRAEMCFSTVFL